VEESSVRLYAGTIARSPSVPRISNRNSVPFGGAAFEVDRCDRAPLENAAEEHLVGEGHRDRLSCLNDRNSLSRKKI
jgi:hypothetical protein